MAIEQLELIPKSPHCIFARCGVVFKEGISFHDWADIGQRLVLVCEAAQWMIGDWLNWGHAKYDRTKYTVALETLPYKYQTLANFRSEERRVGKEC